MAKRQQKWNEKKLEKFIKEGRGQGEGKDYKPWLTVQDFPSMGIATRVMGKTTERMHHFFSNTQLKYFYLLEWEDSVVDIREHFPLLNIEESLDDIFDLNLNKFVDKDSEVPYILSTTFLITILDSQGNKKYAARSIKYSSELKKKITLEKLEIERRYWREVKGIDWGIVTNKEISNIRAKNIEWLHPIMLNNEKNGLGKNELEDLSQGLLYRLKDSEMSINKVVLQYEKDYELDKGIGILLLKYLLANKTVSVDMDKSINLGCSFKEL
ncbi:MAG: heteromeric transposase endonuclease subunit TnsA [Firmicutes bacterium]|nr:heteromeric transposase endonuclease subunit TnsA [Bacillota bacterium]